MIIGLIVGGVLVGQDLINAATIRAQISQIEKYNTAVRTFQGKYGGIPGDLSLDIAKSFGFTTSDCLGDGSSPYGGRNGNGLIEGAGVNSPLATYMGENELFWLDLSLAGLIDFNVLDSRANICEQSVTVTIPNQYLPIGAIGNNNFVDVYGINGYNWFMVSGTSDFSYTHSHFNGVATMSVIQASDIDKKVDDGLPTTGNVVAVYITSSQTATTPAPNATSDSIRTCYNTTSNKYSVGYNNGANLNCALSLRFQ